MRRMSKRTKHERERTAIKGQLVSRAHSSVAQVADSCVGSWGLEPSAWCMEPGDVMIEGRQDDDGGEMAPFFWLVRIRMPLSNGDLLCWQRDGVGFPGWRFDDPTSSLYAKLEWAQRTTGTLSSLPCLRDGKSCCTVQNARSSRPLNTSPGRTSFYTVQYTSHYLHTLSWSYCCKL